MRIILTFLTCLFIANCYGQTLDVRAGANFSKRQFKSTNPFNNTDFTAISGVNFGILYGHKFNDVLGFRSGLDFNTRGYKYTWDVMIINSNNSPSDTTFYQPESKQKNYYLDLPIHLQWHFEIDKNLELTGFFGPYVGYQIAGRWPHGTVLIDTSGFYDNRVMAWDDLKNGFESRWDFGLQFGGSVIFHNFIFEAVFALGLKSRFYANQSAKTAYRSGYFSLGYRIELD